MISKIEFEHGETTCAIDGKYCKFLDYNFHQNAKCRLFELWLDHEGKYPKRCSECLTVLEEKEGI